MYAQTNMASNLSMRLRIKSGVRCREKVIELWCFPLSDALTRPTIKYITGPDVL
jgi:hypothetical protein